MEHPCRTPEDPLFSLEERKNRTTTLGCTAKREGNQDITSPIIKHFVSLFAVLHTTEYAPMSLHRAQGAFIPKGAAAERCIMVTCPLGSELHSASFSKRKVLHEAIRSGVRMGGKFGDRNTLQVS